MKQPGASWAPPAKPGEAIAKARADRQRYQAETARVMRSFPELQLRVYAIQLGVKLEAIMWYPADADWHREVRCVAEALWQPAEVTPEKLVEWGQRALARWLADEAERAVAAESE